MTRPILILMAMMIGACAMDTLDRPSGEDSVQQGLQTCCDPDDPTFCWTTAGSCGTGGGAGGGGGGGGGGGCPIVDINGTCQHPNVGSCLSQQQCDPTLTPFGGPDIACAGACGNAQAICATLYRCGRLPTCTEAHYGYCYVP